MTRSCLTLESRHRSFHATAVTLALGALTFLHCQSVMAATLYWDGINGTWGTAANWSTASGATTPDPTAAPSFFDTAVFNISSVNGPETVGLDVDQTVSGLIFNNTGTTMINGSGANRILTLRGALTLNSGAGAVTIGSGTLNQGVTVSTFGAQTWNLASGTSLTLAGISTNANAFTRNQSVFNFTGTGTLSGATTTFNDTIVNPTVSAFNTGANTLTVGANTGLEIGQLISGAGIAANTYITGISSTTITVTTGGLTGTPSGTYTATNGIIGGYATFGDDWASHAASGNAIIATTNYTTTSGANQTMINGTARNYRLTSASSGTTLLSGATQDIGTLLVNDAAARTINLNGNNMRFRANGGIMLASGGGTLTIGAVSTASSNPGFILGGGSNQAGTSNANIAGDLYIINNSTTNPILINSAVATNLGSNTVYGSPTSVVKAGVGTVVLNSGSFTFNTANSGGFVVHSGTLKQGTSAALGRANLNSILNSTYNFTNLLTVNGSDTASAIGVFDLNGLSATVGAISSVNFANPGKITSSVPGSVTLTTINNTGTNFAGIIENGSGTVGLTKLGTSALIIQGGQNGYTGATTLGNSLFGGGIQIAFGQTYPTANNISTNLISASSALVLNNNSTLEVQGRNAAVISQTFNGTTLNAGQSTVTATSNGATSLKLDLGTIARNGRGLVNFVLPTGTQSATNGILIGNSNTAAGYLGNWIVESGNNYLTKDAGGFVKTATYTTQNALGSWVSGASTIYTGSAPTGSIGANINIAAFRFNSAAAPTYTIGGGFTLGTDGILIGSGVGNNLAIITGGTLQTSTSGGELVIVQSNTSNTLRIDSVIGDNGSSALVKGGGGTVILTNTNSYAGPTAVQLGTLQVGNAGTTGTLGSGAVSIAAGGTLQFSRTDTPTLTNAISNFGTINLASGGATFNGIISGDGGLTVNSATAGATTTLGGLNTYRGNTIVTNGRLTVANGGAINTGNLGGDLIVGSSSTQGQRGIFTIGTGASSTTAYVTLGANATSAGAIYQTGGSVSALLPTAGAQFNNFNVGFGASGSYGYYKLTGGTVNAGEFTLSSNNNGNGVVDVTGGLLTSATNIRLARTGSGTLTNSSLNVLSISGGIVTQTGSGALQTNINSSNSTATINLSGGILGSAAGSSGFSPLNGGTSAAANLRSILNLNGGIFQTLNISAPTLSGTSSGNVAQLNFNGGTLKATATSTTFINNLIQSTFTATGSGAYIYSGGATIDTNNFTSTVTTPLQAPTGQGVSSIAVSGLPTGFIGAPLVVITGGGGVGATAVANFDETTGTVTGITVTNPGTGYTSTPTVALVGNSNVASVTPAAALGTIGITNGSATVTMTNTTGLAVGQMVSGTGIPANTYITAITANTNITLSNNASAAGTAFNYYSLGTATATNNAGNTSGGLTKIGLGTLLFTGANGANTYTGATAINGGGITLDFTASTAATNLINSASALSLSGGTLTLTGKASTTNSQTFASTALNGGLNTFAANANVTANPLLLALGTVTRNNNVTANFVLPTGTQSVTNGITVSNSNNAAGILGTWATVNGTDYATVSGGNVIAATYTTANDLSTWATGATTIYTNSAAFTNSITSTVTIPALRWNTASAANLAIGNGGTLQTDGIFFTNNLGASAGGGITSTGTGVLQTATAGGELVINNSTTTTAQNFLISAKITDNSTSGLTKAGPTRVTLTGANTYAGPTNIAGGTLRADDGTGLPANSLLTINGGVFELNTAGTFSRSLGSAAGNVQITSGLSGFSNGGSSASTINLGGAGTTLQWGSATFNPTTGLVLNSGSATNTITLANGLDLNGTASRTIYNQGANSATISGVISNAVTGALSNLTFNGGTSTIILTNTNTYDGQTTLTGGTLQVGNAATATSTGTTGTLGTGVVGIAGGTLSFNRGGDNITVSNLFTANGGAGTVQHAGAGTLQFSANNSSFFNLNLSGGGTVDLLGNSVNLYGTVQNNGASGSVATVNATGGGRIYLNGSQTISASTGATLIVNAIVDNQPDPNGGTIPTRNLSTGGGGLVVLNGANTYTGKTTIGSGAAQVTSIGTLANPGASGPLGIPFTVNNATIDLGGAGNTGTLRYVGTGETTDRAFNLAGTTGGGGFQNDGTNGALIVSSNFNATGGGAKTITLGGLNTTANTLSGSIIDNSGTNTTGLTKEGTGTWTVSGANTYTGTTIARGGNLILDYTNNDPISATSAVTLDGGTLTFKGKSGGTTDTIASLALSASAVGANKLVLDGTVGAVNLTATTLGGSGGALVSSFIDLSSNASNALTVNAIGANYLKTNSLLVSASGGTSRANIIVKDNTGIGFATLSGATSGTITRIADLSLTTLPASNIGSATVNYLYTGTGSSITVGNGTNAFANNSITVDSSGGTATLNLAANGTINGNTAGLLVRGSNNVTINTAGGANTFNSGTWIVNNYLSGTAALNLIGNLSQTATLELNGPGLTVYSGTALGNNNTSGINLSEGTLRVTTASDWSTLGATGISATASNGWFRSSGVLEIGADLNGVTSGDFTNPIATAAGQNGITFYGDSGVSAFGGNRTVNFGGAGATLTWGASGFLVNAGSTNGDGQYAFKLSSTYSNATVEVQNGLNLNGRSRVFDVANGSAATDAKLSGNIIGGGVGGIVKNGAGTVALTGTNSYTGVTAIIAGTIQFGKQTALYNSTPASWTAANIVVKSGATAAFNVGGTGEFTTGNVTTLLTNLGGTNGTSTTGFAAGSAIGFDTTNASGGTFTIVDNIANSSGVGGGAIGVTKLGTNTLVLTGTNTYTGATSVNNGTLQFAKQTALYNNTPANWTAANVVVKSGATAAFNVGGTGEFTAGNVTTLLTNLGGANGSSSTGFAAGSAIGFDTTNASGGTFTVVDNIANSTGTGGGAIGLSKLGTNTLVLTGANTYAGPTTVTAGALQVGSASVGQTGSGALTAQTSSTILGTGVIRGDTFDLQSGSTLRPGDSVADSSHGTLTFTPASASGSTSNLQGSIILGISGATATDATYGGNALGSTGYNTWLDGISGVGNHDRLVFSNPTAGTGYNLNFLTTTGSLQVMGSSFTPQMGQVFNLFDWGTLLTTNFSGFAFNSGYLTGNGDEGADLDLPDISGSGLAWDFSRFTTSGNIAIVPEPTRALLIMFGSVALLARRRRK